MVLFRYVIKQLKSGKKISRRKAIGCIDLALPGAKQYT
jgi:hypothetical protein